jgi:glutathione S-transferase
VILIGQYDSPYVRRVAVSLTLLGHAFEQAPLSVFGDAEKLRSINPLGRVPALVLGRDPAADPVLVDSGAILDWLDELAGPERALLPPYGPCRQAQLELIALATGCADKVIALAYETRLRPAAVRWGEWTARCRTQAESGLAALEHRLRAARPLEADGGWVGGPRIGQADVTIACLVGYVNLAHPALLDGPYPALVALAAQCEKLPAFAETKPAAYVLSAGS